MAERAASPIEAVDERALAAGRLALPVGGHGGPDLGIEVLAAQEGHVRLRMSVAGWMLNGAGTCHGAFLFLLADTAFGYACNSHGRLSLAVNADIAFLGKVPAGTVLVADARERYRQRRDGLYDVTLRDGSGAVVAEFRGRCRELVKALADDNRGEAPVTSGRQTSTHTCSSRTPSK